MSRLADALSTEIGDSPPTIVGWLVHVDREPNWSWSEKVWRWGAAQQRATHFLQLQDDVIVAPRYWDYMRAMVEAVPDQIICLQGAHPAFRLLADAGHRWAVSRAWMVGVGYVIPTADLTALLEWRDTLHQGDVQATNEDELIARFCIVTKREVWHPIPTVIDHDVTIKSVYGNDAHNYRRPSITWREFGEELAEVDFWRPKPDTLPPVVRNPHNAACWMCLSEPAILRSAETGAMMGAKCVAKGVNSLLANVSIRREL
jgi:hypothetical protein